MHIHMNASAYLTQTKGMKTPEAEVPGSYELPDMDFGR